LKGDSAMPGNNRDQIWSVTGKRIPACRHDAGSGANETVDGLDAATEELRHATEDTPPDNGASKIEKVPVFDRAGLPPKL
jgi:hypothetical protein